MKLLEVRDSFIKFETKRRLALSSFLQINDNDKKYIAQVVQAKQAGDSLIGYAKIIYLYDGTFLKYDNTNPSKDAELLEFDYEIFNKSFSMLGEIPVITFATNHYDANRMMIKRIMDIMGA